ncbi:late embryogenesis abundant protein D-34-like [Rhodamnia argentea]|uniref:Late embryogenesis abundant protein D-34-like n=1 Tax=Rhodamnia argentea TaxID=178133 RepID=A0A8B8PPG2_9MYRT|nr:late embryogenesis abundant protein D-34-like [Rhodamnia argentea]
MSQEQPRRPREEQRQRQPGVEPIKYGDVFSVASDLALKPIAPQDAATMHTAEAAVLGQPPRGGPEDAMCAAAEWNERVGLVGREDRTDVVAEEGVTVTEAEVPGGRIITEKVARQVVGQYIEGAHAADAQVQAVRQSAITIGEALEAAGQSAGGKPVDRGDAAAIFVAEQCVTGSSVAVPGGLAASAQTAAAYNEETLRDDAKIRLSDVLTGAAVKLPADRAANREDTERVANAELRTGGRTSAHPGGVVASVAAAVRLNESITNP